MLCGFGEYVCANWFRPDEGIWEPRIERQHNTHSRVLCWVALDRLIELHEKKHLQARRIDDFVRTRANIVPSVVIAQTSRSPKTFDAFVREDGNWKLLSIELVHSLAYPGSIEDLSP